MKSVLLAAAALALFGGAAAAQDYPPCTHPGQDRCVQTSGSMGRMHVGSRHHGRGHGHHRHMGRHHHHHHR